MSVLLEEMTSTTMRCGRSWEGLGDHRRRMFARAQALQSATDSDSHQIATEFLEFLETTGLALFADEEEWVFRWLRPRPRAVTRAFEEHIRIASLVDAVIHQVQAVCVDVRVVRGLGELLAEHLLSEEGDVRPLVYQPPLAVTL